MSSMDKYIEWLDRGNEILNLRVTKDSRLWVDKSEALEMARRLAAEEKAQRATAPASLVEELKLWRKHLPTNITKWESFEVAKFDEILARYRPAPDRTAELVKRLREWKRIWLPELYNTNPEANKAFNEILADFEKEGI